MAVWVWQQPLQPACPLITVTCLLLQEEDDGAADQIAAPAGEVTPKDLEEGEIAQSLDDQKAAAPQKEEKDMTPAQRKAARIAAKRAVLLAAEEELKVCSIWTRQYAVLVPVLWPEGRFSQWLR